MKKISLINLILVVLLTGCGTTQRLSVKKYGFNPNTKSDAAKAIKSLISDLHTENVNSQKVISFPKGTYHIYPENAFEKIYYISNHDQDNPKKVGFVLENLKNVTIDGKGSEFIFHGRMIPFALVNCENVSLKNFSIDFEIPAFRQLTILSVNKNNKEVVGEIYPAVHHRIEGGNKLIAVGEGYENPLSLSMGFREDRRLTYKRGDISFDSKKIERLGDDKLKITGWNETQNISVGERYALRSYYRPTPGIFVSECKNTNFENVTVHYAEGMGLLAQISENFTLKNFNVALKGKDDKRYFTTQADATHFSACKGKIISDGGLYEGMADDAINVHGTYLRITKRVNANTIEAIYMHPQAYGFKWGDVGDDVQVIESEKMEIVQPPFKTKIKSIRPVDKPQVEGSKTFEISFTNALPEVISEKGKFGIENLTWTPEVVFSNNIIRNNRARGSLFSTPRNVSCVNNTFDHTHGTAILLCGDCNGWYETGACRKVEIKGNKFINALTAYYQFTNAVISIYPEIPNLKGQTQYFHSGIVIEDNVFEMFDKPILYAKSVDGLVFRNNRILYNNEFEPFHNNKFPFFFQRVNNVLIDNNTFEKEFNPQTDIKTELSSLNAVTVK